MREYANVHDLLQKRRAAALASNSEGPRTMVQDLPPISPLFFTSQMAQCQPLLSALLVKLEHDTAEIKVPSHLCQYMDRLS